MKRTLRILLALVVVVALLAMTGCGFIAGRAVKSGVESATGVKVNESGNSVTVTGQDGATVSSSADGKIPEGFPSDMPLYVPGSIKAGIVSDSGSGKGFMVAIETPDAPAAVFAWYETQLKDKGWTVQTTMKTGEGGLLTGEKGSQVFTVAVSSGSDTQGATGVSISVGPKE
jgi:hypothetical protein